MLPERLVVGKAAAGDQLPPGDATVLCLLVHSADSGHAQQGLAAKGQHRFQRAGAVHRLKGSGGILCPLCYDEAKIQLEDVIRELGLACLIVADAGLGTINDVVLTAGYMRARNIPVQGIIFNHYHAGDVMEEDNRNMCESLTGLTVLACVKDGDTELAMEAEALASLYEPGEEVSI